MKARSRPGASSYDRDRQLAWLDLQASPHATRQMVIVRNLTEKGPPLPIRG
ncbi:hypothetical protein [Austwickia chelonae]|uniref:hypothetical protein n=1 Tax=Austwickia chelonae TaxID=100225 RepID=UPI00030DBD2D|nr:hypothetical protein [Austwickia chelonae]